MQDTFSSPTHNAETSVDFALWNAFHHWELSASSHESLTRMEDFICTVSQTSDGSFEVERLTYSMWTVTTRTLSLLREHQRRVTTTQSRMAMLLREASSDQSGRAELELGRLLISGLKLRVRRIENHFGSFVINWIPKVLHVHTASLPSMRTGDLQKCLPNMSHQEDLSLLGEMLMVEMSGYHQLVSDWETHR
ncbi:putative ORF3 protein [Giant panda associated gemycircularvirus]|uniref:Putative ORF3 protein n=1 Tax=Giant panda associated gemycircularvirus TaxID=2016461 RepID=A0A220IGM4_9VIRU|nr:putative ORF3 protein [Giant panda associated gemycircularvirus]ASH99144.1 putative ORF3 protein [Giant panda associated gemycircularvirus]ASH99153.1 putative ORF3 protein [Giant panda associated gemycircularvirus]